MKKLAVSFICLVFSISMYSCIEDKSHLLTCDKPWNERSEYEQIIGEWHGEYFQLNAGRYKHTQEMKFQGILHFYSDHTMKEFQRSESAIRDKNSVMDSGTDVHVKNGVLTYKSENYGDRKFTIHISETELIIDEFTTISGNKFSK